MLRLRHAHSGLSAGQPVWWAQSPNDVLALRRGAGFACVVNLSAETVESPIEGAILLASDPTVTSDDSVIMLPPNTGAWIQS
jgi:alpha-glucosidase